MLRRKFLRKTLLAGAGLSALVPLVHAAKPSVHATASKLKITKIRYYGAPGYTKPLFNQARGIVEVETDGGVIGIGEGGAKDTIEQCAQMLIGEDPFRI
ncbi:MAG TPA: hypothetical protein VK666_05270, partial [Chryseolinea sp.]|nr:hypothetical protein [Chryseolinea sp.]